MLISKRYISIFYLICCAFLFINAYFVTKSNFVFNLLPVFILLGIVAAFSIDNLFLFIVFFTPISLNISDIINARISPDLSLPTEPFLFLILAIVLIKIGLGFKFEKSLINHPMSLVILFHLGWLFLTSLTSTMPIVSFKFFLARLWFVVPSYFFCTQVFKKEANINRFLWLYIIPFTGVIIYTLYQHSLYNFAEHPANWVVKPFYNDHTSYGAMLAMLIPVLVGFVFLSPMGKTTKFIAIVLFVFYLIATVFSYTRASWVSLAAALGMLAILKLKIQFKTLFACLVLALIGFFIFQQAIVNKLEANNKQSSDNLTDHVQSISNISSDASNKERINRWNCAIRMFKKKPFFGYGPGTYSFQYAPFQYRKEKTIISTDHGDGGNAHSEYLGPLAEGGLIGLLSFASIVLVLVATSMRLYYTLDNSDLKITVAILLLGLVTYFVHGFMNNFLDTDKASIPFWGFIAAIVAIDLYHSKRLLKPTTD